ncbi:MAG: ZIP family metal transporter [Desulfocucumaceae bacterium]
MPDNGLAVSVLSGMATGLGGLLAAFAGRAWIKAMPALLGLSAGIGFTVVFFDLLPGALKTGPWLYAGAGMASGIAFGRAAGIVFPHLHASGTRGRSLFKTTYGTGLLRTGCLFALGVAMHNFPEGLAVGAGMEAGPHLGVLLAAAIGLHNIPEGMALGGLFIMGGVRPLVALAIASGAGLVLPLGTLVAGVWITAVPGMLSFLMALGAGVMLYIILSEVIPGSFRMHPAMARAGIAAGAAVSLAASVLLR